MGDGGLLRNIVDTQLLRGIDQKVHNSVCPIRPVRQQTQVTQGFLRASKLAFLLAELVRECDNKFPKAMALVLRKRKDTCYVVVFGRFFLFREVPDDVGTA